MVNRIALLSVAGAALAAAVLPQVASAADYYDEGRGSVVPHSQQDVEIEDDRAYPEQRRDVGRFAPRGPGPVVFDERGPGRFDRPAYRGPEGGYRGPAFVQGLADEERGPFGGPRFGRPDNGEGLPYRVAPRYRAVAAGGDGEAFDERAGLPDVGCTIQQSQSVTPAGWRKIVTHRTCYRR